MTEIKAVYDQLISTIIRDTKGVEVRRVEHHHFVFGQIGDEISGGFYIRKGTEIPESLVLKIPNMEGVNNEQGKS